jgi:hypothetical protein
VNRRRPGPRQANVIGRQSAGQITNVAGNQYIEGGTHGTIGAVGADLADLEEIRRRLDEIALTRRQREDADAALEETRHELSGSKPDTAKVAQRLEQLAGILKAAGVLAGAGVVLVDPIARIALTLGAAGVKVLQMLRE